MADTHDREPVETRFNEVLAKLFVVARRALTLSSDAVVLTLASPFFAVWWVTRLVRRVMRKG